MSVFDEMGKYWAEISDQNQTERQVQFIKNLLKTQELVLDVACGTGRHLIPLCKEGYDIVGLDISAKLLRIAKTRWHRAQLVRADMRFLPFKPHTFSAVISMDQSLGYLPSETEDLQSLRELHAALRKGSVLVADVFNNEQLIKRYYANGESKLREYPSFFLLQERTVTVDGKWLHDLWTVRDKVDGQTWIFEHVARLYAKGGLQGLLEQAGFEVAAVFGDYEGQSWMADSNRLVFFAKAT